MGYTRKTIWYTLLVMCTLGLLGLSHISEKHLPYLQSVYRYNGKIFERKSDSIFNSIWGERDKKQTGSVKRSLEKKNEKDNPNMVNVSNNDDKQIQLKADDLGEEAEKVDNAYDDIDKLKRKTKKMEADTKRAENPKVQKLIPTFPRNNKTKLKNALTKARKLMSPIYKKMKTAVEKLKSTTKVRDITPTKVVINGFEKDYFR